MPPTGLFFWLPSRLPRRQQSVTEKCDLALGLQCRYVLTRRIKRHGSTLLAFVPLSDRAALRI